MQQIPPTCQKIFSLCRTIFIYPSEDFQAVGRSSSTRQKMFGLCQTIFIYQSEKTCQKTFIPSEIFSPFGEIFNRCQKIFNPPEENLP